MSSGIMYLARIFGLERAECGRNNGINGAMSPRPRRLLGVGYTAMLGTAFMYHRSCPDEFL